MLLDSGRWRCRSLAKSVYGDLWVAASTYSNFCMDLSRGKTCLCLRGIEPQKQLSQ